MGAAATRNAGRYNVFQSERLERVFADCFFHTLQTRLVGGAAEPLYRPAPGEDQYHSLYYRQDYFASALHEVAHWCIAGPGRRRQVDFGYWYAPDGRSTSEQRAFAAVEYKPQALEWYFSRACGYDFRVSLDNLDGEAADMASFRGRILQQALSWQRDGLPERAGTFFRGLCRQFDTPAASGDLHFSLDELA